MHTQKDKYKQKLIHNYPLLRPFSLNLLLNISVIKIFSIWFQDLSIDQDFVQDSDLNRVIFLESSPEFW